MNQLLALVGFALSVGLVFGFGAGIASALLMAIGGGYG